MSQTPPPTLDAGLLDAYESRLRAEGLPVDEWARPGLTEDEMKSRLAPIGLDVPIEGRAWWGWHDGAVDEGKGKLLGPRSTGFLSLAEAVKTYIEYRDIVATLVEPDIPELANADDRWNPAWLPIQGPQLPCVIDCSVPPGAPTPVRFIDLQDVEGSPIPKARSLGEVVTWRIEALDSGAWRWDQARRAWEIELGLMDLEFRMNPLV